ncbi:MAG TPA: polysaccharide biosynthesis tyrosine autokinase, partial [Coleofasciculaceae cyanobacterium]
VASLALLKALNETPVYQATFQILTKPVTVEGEVISSVPQTLTGRREGTAAPETATVDETKIKVLLSPRVLSPVVEKLQAKYPGFNYGSLVGSLTIAPSGPSILDVGYQSSDPKLVKDVLDFVSKAFLNYSLEERQTDIRQGLAFVEKQLPQLESRVETQQERLLKIRQQFNLVDPQKTGEQLSAQISTVEQQRVDNQVQLKQAQALYSELQTELTQKSAEAATASALAGNARYQKILDQLQDIDSQIAKESALFLEESPTIEILREQRQNLLPLLSREGQRVQGELASRIEELQTRSQVLSQTVESLNKQVKQLSVINREYNDIEQELKIATDNLNQFLAKREGLRIDAAQRQIPWQLLAPLGEPIPSAASAKKNLILGTILGLLLGLGVALVVDKLSNVMFTSKEVKDLTKLPLLGVIPFEKDLGEFAPAGNVGAFVQNPNGLGNNYPLQTYRRSDFFEVFRSLYTNIRLLGSDTPIHSLVISSATHEDGKSTVAVYLAQAAAAMGQRVLLVDTNLRGPTIHNRVGLMNIQGLTDVISSDLDFNDVIEQSPLEENLFVLTAGSIPPDPIRLLASQKMQDLMDKLQSAFDLVIYDTPPLVGIADAYLLATHTNGIVLVAGLGKLKRVLLEQALDELRVVGTPVLGAVANRAKESMASSSSYYQRSYMQNSNMPMLGDNAETDTSVLDSLKKIRRR